MTLRINSVFKGKLLHFLIQRLRLPNGCMVDLEVIRHPGAALVVPFLSTKRIILLRQLRPVLNMYMYELPAGTLKKGESTLACARREIIEETGYSARSFTRLGVIYPVPGYSTEKIVIYKAAGLKKEGSFFEKDEIIENRIFTRKEVIRLFRRNKITDAKTICAFTLCGWL